jgi:hypothetical protein
MRWAVVGAGGFWLTVAGLFIRSPELAGAGLGLFTLAVVVMVWSADE